MALRLPEWEVAVAGLKKYVRERALTGQVLMRLMTGSHVNFDRLTRISERTELGENREAVIAVNIDEKPGSYRQFSMARLTAVCWRACKCRPLRSRRLRRF